MVLSIVKDIRDRIMSETTEKHSILSSFGRWVAELVLVFVGVYAAFWLNNYQQRQQDVERRDRIQPTARLGHAYRVAQ